jgi:oligopeptide transport system substrate-binding protein
MYKQAEQLLLVDDPGIITTYYQDLQTFRYKWLKNIVTPLFGGYYLLRDSYIQGRQ